MMLSSQIEIIKKYCKCPVSLILNFFLGGEWVLKYLLRMIVHTQRFLKDFKYMVTKFYTDKGIQGTKLKAVCERVDAARWEFSAMSLWYCCVSIQVACAGPPTMLAPRASARPGEQPAEAQANPSPSYDSPNRPCERQSPLPPRAFPLFTP